MWSKMPPELGLWFTQDSYFSNVQMSIMGGNTSSEVERACVVSVLSNNCISLIILNEKNASCPGLHFTKLSTSKHLEL